MQSRIVDERPFIETFHKVVLGQSVDASGHPLIAPKSHPSLMINPRTMSFTEIIERGQKYFGLPKAYEYKKLSEARSTAQGRPAEQYAFAHVGGAQRDMPGISYNKAKTDKLCFLDPEEYALATFYSKWRNGDFLDAFGWTRLDALLSDDRAVYSYWYDDRFDFSWGNPSHGNADSGPRSAVIL